MPHLVVVPHTHWDREWYRTHEQFRARLVALLDALLPLLEHDPEFRCFSLDGQTIVLDDYLAVRPDERARIETLVRAGRLVIGPWTVLPDEWLVSGEALVRNLRLGLARGDAFGGAQRLGYVPDQFGHVGQLPQIFAGFGFEGAVLWRGVGADVAETLFRWEAPDGSAVFAGYLPNGYFNGQLLPTEPAALAARLGREIERLAPFAKIPTLLVMNGSDHQTPEAGLPRALREAVGKLEGVSAEVGTLLGYLTRARREARAELPVHRGELRSGLRSPLLPGCASARMPQKRRDFANDSLLVRALEPLSAWVAALGGTADPGTIEFAWRVALENHPHDSICGCSVDAVHRQMETRFDRVAEIAGEALEKVGRQWVARVAPAPGRGATAGDPFVVWNPNAAGPALIDAELELDVRGAKTAHVRDSSGRRIPAELSIVGAGSSWGGSFPRGLAESILPAIGGEFLGYHVNEVAAQREAERLLVRARLGASPRGDLDVAATKLHLSRALADPAVTTVEVEAQRPPRVRLRFVDDLPGHGLRSYRVFGGAMKAPPEDAVTSGASWIENRHWRVSAASDGRITLLRRADGVTIDDALRVASEGDRGDEYNFDPVPDSAPVERPERVRIRVERAGTAAATLVLALTYRVPESLAQDRARRSERSVALPVSLRVRLSGALDRIDLEVSLDNTARDHRLRLLARAPFAASRFRVESAFEISDRPIAPPADAFGPERPSELPIGACPQRTFASLAAGERALSVANRGNAEAEAVPEPDGTTSLAVTLLRAVGHLSCGDLRLRRGHAGPPFETPDAQVPGRHRAELALRLHPADDPDWISALHRFAYAPVVLAGAGGEDAPLSDGARLLTLDDPEVVVSAIEPRPDGSAIVRIYEAAGRARSVSLAWNAPGDWTWQAVDLSDRFDERANLRKDGAAIIVPLRACEIRTLRVRPK
ncbi:MAG TPA: glycoside hydrolase family 38 C-terminal domain-containing protein [Myxococcota bacterium]|nr:glycoside hydrolase family 38 C-terminal domain-containing protein [Myxococcota bacterium]